MITLATTHTESTLRENVIGTFMVFMYIFSFYVLGPITSSVVGAGMVFISCIRNTDSWNITKRILKSNYFIGIIAFLSILMNLCVFYSTIHLTHDFSYLKTLVGQLIQLICGGIIVSYLFIRCNANIDKIIRWIIIAYILQSIIELIAVSFPTVGSSLDYFNHAGEDQEKSGGVRGMALASGTTWSLGLTYGIAFILYFGTVLSYRINIKTTIGLLFIIIGTVFAGRTGFVGALIGSIYFLLFSRKNLLHKSMLLVDMVLILTVLVLLIFIMAPKFVEYMIFNVMPWAFEPIFNYIDHGVISTGSTDRLDEMWHEIPTINEALLGTGHFTNIDGSYYRRTDVGILRNLFYWGVGGYMMLIIYHIYLMWPGFKIKKYRLLWFFIMVYLFVCEYKAMTLGYNKQVISILVLVSLTASCSYKKLSKYD